MLIRVRPTAARAELSPEERSSLGEKLGKAFKEAGGKELASFDAWSSEWRTVGVNVFPDMEAYHKWWIATLTPRGLHSEKYWDIDVTLVYERPA